MGPIWANEYGTDGYESKVYVTDMGQIWDRYETDMAPMNMTPMDMGPKDM